MPIAGPRGTPGIRETAEAIARPQVLRATAFVMAPSILFGVIAVLVPLRMSDLGGGAGGGRRRVHGRRRVRGGPLRVGRPGCRIAWGGLRPYVFGMVVSAAGLALVPAGQALGVIVALLIVMSVGAGLCFAPALAMLSDAAEASGLHQGLAAGLINVAWAAGQVLGQRRRRVRRRAPPATRCRASSSAACSLVVAFAARQNGVGRARYVARA